MAAALALATTLVAHTAVLAQPGAPTADDERERQFVESLRREDTQGAERYVALRDARSRATAELQQAHDRVNAAGPGLRGIFLPQVRQAQHKYAETSLALLDFLEERDRRALATYQEQIDKIKGLLDERKKTRAELEDLLRGN